MFLQFDKPFTFDRIIRILIILVLFFCTILLIRYLSDVLIPFAVAVLLAYIFDPVVDLVQKVIKPRTPAVVITILFIALIITGISLLIIPLMFNEIVRLGEILSNLVNSPASRDEDSLAYKIWLIIIQFIDEKQLQNLFNEEQLYNIGKSVAEKMLPGIWGVIQGALSFLSGIIIFTIVIMYTIFLLIGYDKYNSAVKNMIPIKFKDNIIEFVHEFKSIMNKYFRGQALIALIQGTILAISFSIVGLPMSIFLGLFIGLLNMIPYMQILGIIPTYLIGTIYALDSGNSIWTILIIISLIFVATQLLQDYFLTPKILGKVTGLNPVLIILSIFTWGKLLGFLGLILALPLTYLIISYYRRMLVEYNKRYLNELNEEMHQHDSE
jgi:predicted PurR-regulated permease PerM